MDKDKEKVITVPTPSMSMSGRVPGPERRSVGDIAPSPSASGKGKSDCANNAGARPVTRAKASPTDDVAALEGGDQNGGGGGGGGPYHPPRANGLWLTAFYLAFNTMATGVFAVPEAYTKLGVGGGSIAVTVIFAICWYTMHRLWALRQSHKEAIGTYQDLGSFYIGAGFKTFMAVIIYAKIFLGATSEFTLTAALLLRDLTKTQDMPTGLCFVIASVIILGVVLIPGQLRSVHTYSLYASVPGLVTIVAALIVAWFGFSVEANFEVAQDIEIFNFPTLFDGATAIGDITYSFAGAVVFVEVMKEMKDERVFPKALSLMLVFNYVFVIITGCVVYVYAAGSVQSPLFLGMAGAVGIVANALALAHVVLVVPIETMVLIRHLYEGLFGSDAAKLLDAKGASWKESSKTYGLWALLSLGVYGAGFLVVNAIPFFSQFNSLVAALLTNWTTIGFPALFFALELLRRRRQRWGHTASHASFDPSTYEEHWCSNGCASRASAPGTEEAPDDLPEWNEEMDATSFARTFELLACLVIVACVAAFSVIGSWAAITQIISYFDQPNATLPFQCSKGVVQPL